MPPATSPGGVLGSGLWVPKQQSPVSFPSLGAPERGKVPRLQGLHADASRPSSRSPRVPARVRGCLKGSPKGWNPWVPRFQW